MFRLPNILLQAINRHDTREWKQLNDFLLKLLLWKLFVFYNSWLLGFGLGAFSSMFDFFSNFTNLLNQGMWDKQINNQSILPANWERWATEEVVVGGGANSDRRWKIGRRSNIEGSAIEKRFKCARLLKSFHKDTFKSSAISSRHVLKYSCKFSKFLLTIYFPFLINKRVVFIIN